MPLMNPDPSGITILGLGAMGSALAATQLDAGRATTVWNRSTARAEPLVTRGAILAPDAHAAIEANPLSIVCVVDNRATRAVLEEAALALSGRVVVNLTNGTPGQARTLAAWVHEHGAKYIDGGIMAVPPMIGTPGAAVFYSGAADAFATHRSTLEAFGEARYLGEDPGSAAAWDLALLSAMYGMYAGVLHAVALARGQGIPATELIPPLQAWLAAMEAGLPQFAEQVDTDQHATASPLAMQAQGFVNLVEASREAGVRPDLLLPVGELLEEAVAAGCGDDGITSLVRLLERSQVRSRTMGSDRTRTAVS
jgi:3-hydroxyisobutyrate dehydrogenase-like beta-hydroxyacid dehydrogenase